MISLKEVMNFLNASEEDVIALVVDGFSPPVLSNTKNQLREKHQRLRQLATLEQLSGRLAVVDYRCEDCKGGCRVGFALINTYAPYDCSIGNLKVLCSRCKKGVGVQRDMKYTLFLTAIRLWKSTGQFPENKEIMNSASVDNANQYYPYLNFLRTRAAQSN